jgi:transcriptional regulator with XRE-family HTH domain
MDLTSQNCGVIFKTRRLALNYIQDYVAYKLKISQNSYSKIELGYVQLTLDRFLCICQILDIDIAALLTANPVAALQSEHLFEPAA